MARARNIKPAFFDNDALAELDPLARLLFIGMWTIADYKGDFEWREKRVKAKLLPYDDCDINNLAINLDESGFIRFYSDGENIYCNVSNFCAHQNPHKNEREKGSEIPEYSEDMRQLIDLKGLTINRDKSGLKRNDSTSDRADSLNLIPDCLNPPTAKPKRFDFKKALLSLGVSPEVATQFMEIRKKKKSVNTEYSLNLIINEAGRAGIKPCDAVNFSTDKGWAGFNSSWYKKEQGEKYKTLSDIANDDTFTF